MRTTTTNAAVVQVAAQKVAAGGDASSSSLPSTMSPHKSSPKARKGSREHKKLKRGTIFQCYVCVLCRISNRMYIYAQYCFLLSYI